jgi:hypothetical protein
LNAFIIAIAFAIIDTPCRAISQAIADASAPPLIISRRHCRHCQAYFFFAAAVFSLSIFFALRFVMFALLFLAIFAISATPLYAIISFDAYARLRHCRHYC